MSNALHYVGENRIAGLGRVHAIGFERNIVNGDGLYGRRNDGVVPGLVLRSEAHRHEDLRPEFHSPESLQEYVWMHLLLFGGEQDLG